MYCAKAFLSETKIFSFLQNKINSFLKVLFRSCISIKQCPFFVFTYDWNRAILKVVYPN